KRSLYGANDEMMLGEMTAEASQYLSNVVPVSDVGGGVIADSESEPLNETDSLDVGIIFWEPVGIGASSFGHVSTRIDDKSYSTTPSGKLISSFEEYRDKNKFRNGVEIIIKLTSGQKKLFEECMQKVNDYDFLANNCATDAQVCLQKVGVSDFFTPVPRFIEVSTIGENGSRRYSAPVEFLDGLRNSSVYKGERTHYATERTKSITNTAPWGWMLWE
ncbi:MAG: hypothetical protein ACRCWR_06885, partial [Saezia sp.]